MTRPRAVEIIAEALREDVLTGRMEPGESLREERLAERFDASRHTVRAALAVLVAERLLTAEPYRGVRVTALDDVQLAELQQLRAAIESEAVRSIVDRDLPLDGVRDRIARLGMLETAAGEWIVIERAHAAVHQALVDAAGSARLSELYRSLEGELALLLLHTREVFVDRDLAAEHLRWLVDIEERGVEAVHAHLAGSTRELLELRSSAPSR